jgi:hypothetical protein
MATGLNPLYVQITPDGKLAMSIIPVADRTARSTLSAGITNPAMRPSSGWLRPNFVARERQEADHPLCTDFGSPGSVSAGHWISRANPTS